MSACTLVPLPFPTSLPDTGEKTEKKRGKEKIEQKGMSSGRFELSTSGSLVSLSPESYYETSALPTELRRRLALELRLASWPLYWVGGWDALRLYGGFAVGLGGLGGGG